MGSEMCIRDRPDDGDDSDIEGDPDVSEALENAKDDDGDRET